MNTPLEVASLVVSLLIGIFLIGLTYALVMTNRVTFYTRLFDIYTQVFKDRINELEGRLGNPKSREERELTLEQIRYNKNTLKLVQSMLIGNLKPGKIFTNKIAKEITGKILEEEDSIVQLYSEQPN